MVVHETFLRTCQRLRSTFLHFLARPRCNTTAATNLSVMFLLLPMVLSYRDSDFFSSSTLVLHYIHIVITRFWGRFSCYPSYNNQRETRLRRRRLLEARDLLQQDNPVGRERIRSQLAPTAEFNPITKPECNPTRDRSIRRPTAGDVTREQHTKHLYIC